MKIKPETISQVNQYTAENMTKKGNKGYIYFKHLLTYSVQSYKNKGQLIPINIKEIMYTFPTEEPYINIYKSLAYYLKTLNYESIQDAVIDYTEKIINNIESKINFIKEETKEEEF